MAANSEDSQEILSQAERRVLNNEADKAEAALQLASKVTWEDEIAVLVDPKSHIMHTLLWAVGAVFTFLFLVIVVPNNAKHVVTLTNFKMLRPSDLTSALQPTSQDALSTRWLCQAKEPWGPDSMCKCITSNPCKDAAACAASEKKCYATVVPVYAHVFAGYDATGYNIVIAFFFIHMAVMLNMATETVEEEEEKQKKKGEIELDELPQLDAGKALLNPIDDTEYTAVTNRLIMGRFQRLGPKSTTFKPPNSEKDNLLPAAENPQQTAEETKKSRMWTHWFSEKIKSRFVRLFFLEVLAAFCFILSIIRLDLVKGKDSQTCDLGQNTCMTQHFISTVTMVLSIVDILYFAAAFYHEWREMPFKHAVFVVSTTEDIHYIAAFMLLISSFTALSGVHDDMTIMFDVLLMLFIGFMQSLQHNIMLAREVFVTHCETYESIIMTDNLSRKHSVASTILSYFLYTRLFIFVVIGGASFVFFERIDSSVGGGGTTANWNSYMRFVASLVSLTPSLFGDVSFEIQNHMSAKAGKYVQYSGAHGWRRTIYLMYIIIFVVFSFKNYGTEKNT